MQVADVMTRGVRTMKPSDTLLIAAQAMDEMNVGVMPVCDGERLVGMVTDRDIAMRGVAQGRTPDTRLSDVMSGDVQWCYDDDSVDDVAAKMRDAQIRRLPVVDHDKHLVGILSLGDIAVKAGEDEASDALAGISEPAEPDRSHLSAASGQAGGGQSGGPSGRG